MVKLVVSYRRNDTGPIAGRIFDRLVGEFGRNSVFMDIDSIPYGVDYRAYIEDALRNADVLLAIIGASWLGSRSKSRIKAELDPVRIELESAYNLDIPILPVLIDDARMPSEAQLPASLSAFPYLNAAFVDAGRDFNPNIERLIGQLRTRFKAASAKRAVGSRTDRSWIKLSAVAVPSVLVVLSAVAYGAYRLGPRQDTATAPAMAVAAVPPPASGDDDRLPCDREGRIGTPSGAGNAILLTFRNDSASVWQIFWLNGQGKRQKFGALATGQALSFNTFTGHPWLIADPSGACASIYLPSSSNEVVTIR